MDFVAVVDQAIALLRQRGRLTYRTLQLQFQLDEAHLEALKDELMYGQRLARDEEGRVLVWTGGSAAVSPPAASPTPAARPLNSRLDTSKFQQDFGLRLPDWQAGVQRMLREVLER